MKICINGMNINYIDCGEGKPILMLHGWGASAACWNGLIRFLSPNFRIVAPDFPGCGESDIPAEPLTNADYADIVKAFMEALGLEDPIVFGHSHGGRVTLKMLEKGYISPKKIVLFGSAGVVLPKPFKKRVKIATYKFIKKVLLLPGVRKFSGGLLDKARKAFGSADYASANDVMRKTMVQVISEDLRHTFKDINASVLLVWGDKDTDTPLAAARIMESEMKDAGLCVIKGAGHYSYIDRPGEVIAILNSFLKEEM